MIELRDLLNIHNILIDKFGGSKGVRDQGSLESAINRPFATFDNQDLYPTTGFGNFEMLIFSRSGKILSFLLLSATNRDLIS